MSPVSSLPRGLEGLQYSDESLPVPTVPSAPEPGASTQDTGKEVFWVTVAAADAPDDWKKKADFVCTGAADQNIIMDAMDEANNIMPLYDPGTYNDPPYTSGGFSSFEMGGVLLSPGTFAINNTIWMNCANLRGTGMHTQIVVTNTTLFSAIRPFTSGYPYWMRFGVRDLTISIRENYLFTGAFQYGIYHTNRSIDLVNVGVHGATVGFYTSTQSSGGFNPEKPAVVRDCTAYKCDTGFWIEDYISVSDSHAIDCKVGFVLNSETSSLNNCYALCEFSPAGDSINFSGNAGIHVYSGQANDCYVQTGPNSIAGIIMDYGEVRGALIYGGDAFGGPDNNGVAIMTRTTGTSEEILISNSRIYGNVVLNKTSGLTRGVYFSDCIFKEGAILATNGTHEMIQVLDSAFYRTFDMDGPFVHIGNDVRAVLDNIVFYNDRDDWNGPMDSAVVSSGNITMSGLEFVGSFVEEIITTTTPRPKNFYGGIEVLGDGAGLYLYSDDGSRHKFTVANDGTLVSEKSTVAASLPSMSALGISGHVETTGSASLSVSSDMTTVGT